MSTPPAIRRVRGYVAPKGKNTAISMLVANASRALLRTRSLEDAKRVAVLMAQAFGRRKKSAITERAVVELERIWREDMVRRRRVRGEEVPVDEAEKPDNLYTQVSLFSYVYVQSCEGVAVMIWFQVAPAR